MSLSDYDHNVIKAAGWPHEAGRAPTGSTLPLTPRLRQSIREWVCRRFGHKPFVVEGPWRKCDPGLFSHAKGRHEHCPRCKARFFNWTTDWRKRGMDP